MADAIAVLAVGSAIVGVDSAPKAVGSGVVGMVSGTGAAILVNL